MFGQLDNAIPVFVPVYVILGHQDEHLGLMIAMEEMKLFDNGKVTISPSNFYNNVVVLIIIIIIVLHMLRFSFPGICQAEGLLQYIQLNKEIADQRINKFHWKFQSPGT